MSAAFLKQLRERHGGRQNAIWDNAPTHRGEAAIGLLRKEVWLIRDIGTGYSQTLGHPERRCPRFVSGCGCPVNHPLRLQQGPVWKLAFPVTGVLNDDLLAGVGSRSSALFPWMGSSNSPSHSSTARLLVITKLDTRLPHGFRSSFRNWVKECTAMPREVAEAAPAHSKGRAL